MKKMKSWFAASLAVVSTVTGSGITALSAKSVWAESLQPTESQTLIHQLVSQTTEAAIIAKTKQSADSKAKKTPFTDNSLEIARMIPSNAYGVAALNLQSESWLHMGHHGLQNLEVYRLRLLTMLDESKDGNPEVKALFKDILEQGPKILGGNLAMAFVPSSAQPDATPILVTWIAITDRGAVESLLDRVQATSKVENSKSTYKGVTIREWKFPKMEDTDETEASTQPNGANPAKSRVTPPAAMAQPPASMPNKDEMSNNPGMEDESEPPDMSPNNDYSPEKILQAIGYKDGFAVAVLRNNYIMIAPNAELIKTTINGVPNNLRENPKFLRTVQNPQWEDSLLTTYGNYGMIVKVLEKVASELPETSEIPGASRKDYLAGLQATAADYDTFDGFFWVTHTALRSRSHSYYTKIKDKPFPQLRRAVLPYLIPSSAYLSASSGNFKEQWQVIVNQAERYPGIQVLVTPVRDFFKQNLGMDFDKEIISWLDGEYALVMYPSKNSPFIRSGSDLVTSLLVRTSNPAAANAALAKITKKLEENFKGIISIRQRFVGGITVNSFEFPDPEKEGSFISAFAYGWRDSQTLLFTAGSATVNDFAPGPKSNLAEFSFFKDAAAKMPEPNLGYFYVNARTVADGMSKFFFTFMNSDENGPGTVPPAVSAFIERLGGLMITYSESTDRIQADSYLGLQPLVKP